MNVLLSILIVSRRPLIGRHGTCDPTVIDMPAMQQKFLFMLVWWRVYWSKMDETKVIYHIDDEDTPYLVKLPKSPSEVTLSDFKNVLNRPSYKFFFKSMDDDFGWVDVYLWYAVCRLIPKQCLRCLSRSKSHFSSGTPSILKRVYICIADPEIRLFWKTLETVQMLRAPEYCCQVCPAFHTC